jgi:hypothetical protein
MSQACIISIMLFINEPSNSKLTINMQRWNITKYGTSKLLFNQSTWTMEHKHYLHCYLPFLPN